MIGIVVGYFISEEDELPTVKTKYGVFTCDAAIRDVFDIGEVVSIVPGCSLQDEHVPYFNIHHRLVARKIEWKS